MVHLTQPKVRIMNTPPSSRSTKRHVRNARKLKSQSTKARSEAPALLSDELKPVHRRAAGIDVGSAENYVAIPAEGLASNGCVRTRLARWRWRPRASTG
jgi:hypothetical protein